MTKVQQEKTSILPTLCGFAVSSALSICLYYVDMITDFLILSRFYKKMIDSNEISQRNSYEFFFYSSLVFTVLPILSLIFMGVLNAKWRFNTRIKVLGKLVTILIGSILNVALVK